MKTIATFTIPFIQFLDEQSKLIQPLPDFLNDPKTQVELYRLMVLTRTFDTKAINLQRTGKLGTYPSTCGQEAVFVGIGHSLRKDDVFIPYYRDFGAMLQRGVKMAEIYTYWGGDERGNDYACGGEDFPLAVPVGSQYLHAVGVATAIKLRKQKRAVLTVCGDGGSSEGDFYEALNVAGVWHLPTVFIVSNNQWAISVPRSAQTSAATLAQKAIAAGIPGEQVDGNDVFAVCDAITRALQKAHAGEGPTLLEICCYRLANHTTADDATRYEAADLPKQAWTKEPVLRLRRYLNQLGVWNEEQEQQLLASCAQEVEQAVQEYLNVPRPEPESMFDYLYATLPRAYHEQRDSVKNRGDSNA